MVVPLWAATEAAKRVLLPEGPALVACDVARYGHDKTVVMRREGPLARIVWRVRGRDTMKTVGFLKSYCDNHDVAALMVDDTGVGGGVVDRLREVHIGRAHLYAFLPGGRAKVHTYFSNRSAEVWWAMRQRYMDGELDTDDDPALIEQVSGRKYSWDSKGRIQLESKEKMYRSPDEADALAMTFATAGGGVRIWV